MRLNLRETIVWMLVRNKSRNLMAGYLMPTMLWIKLDRSCRFYNTRSEKESN